MKNRAICITTCLVLATGCAGTPPAQSISSRYLEQDYKNRFLEYKEECKRQGGIVVISRKMMSSRRSLPRRTDSYSCQFDAGVGVGVSL